MKTELTPLYMNLYCAALQGIIASGNLIALDSDITQYDAVRLAKEIADKAMKELETKDEAEEDATSGV
jgi:hypothetical protein